MNMLPWYKIRMCDLAIKGDVYIYDKVVIEMGKYRASVLVPQPAILLLLRRGIGMQPIDPYPGAIPDYE